MQVFLDVLFRLFSKEDQKMISFNACKQDTRKIVSLKQDFMF